MLVKSIYLHIYTISGNMCVDTVGVGRGTLWVWGGGRGKVHAVRVPFL